SPRYVSTDVAADIAGAMPGDVKVVGVFVNSSAERISRIASSVGLHAFQLHGDEPPALLGEFSGECRIVRARRWSERGLQDVADDLLACFELGGRRADAVLLDAAVTGQFGGTGSTLPWAALKDYPQWLGETPLILAGGLNPENVFEAIHTVRPAGVDVASGVENSPGVKDARKLQSFIQAAHSAFTEEV
ncbi:MAG: phosphoribosylanthranilate isomerase, partial [Planctomycetes bacterium]|nr:phosphoribosylanthranilate isomerase [Planctomycetota bacterium]